MEADHSAYEEEMDLEQTSLEEAVSLGWHLDDLNNNGPSAASRMQSMDERDQQHQSQIFKAFLQELTAVITLYKAIQVCYKIYKKLNSLNIGDFDPPPFDESTMNPDGTSTFYVHQTGGIYLRLGQSYRLLNGFTAYLTSKDVNCLYKTISVALTGNERCFAELRVRTLIEMVLNRRHYKAVYHLGNEDILGVCQTGKCSGPAQMFALAEVISHSITVHPPQIPYPLHFQPRCSRFPRDFENTLPGGFHGRDSRSFSQIIVRPYNIMTSGNYDIVVQHAFDAKNPKASNQAFREDSEDGEISGGCSASFARNFPKVHFQTDCKAVTTETSRAIEFDELLKKVLDVLTNATFAGNASQSSDYVLAGVSSEDWACSVDEHTMKAACSTASIGFGNTTAEYADAATIKDSYALVNDVFHETVADPKLLEDTSGNDVTVPYTLGEIALDSKSPDSITLSDYSIMGGNVASGTFGLSEACSSTDMSPLNLILDPKYVNNIDSEQSTTEDPDKTFRGSTIASTGDFVSRSANESYPPPEFYGKDCTPADTANSIDPSLQMDSKPDTEQADNVVIAEVDQMNVDFVFDNSDDAFASEIDDVSRDSLDSPGTSNNTVKIMVNDSFSEMCTPGTSAMETEDFDRTIDRSQATFYKSCDRNTVQEKGGIPMTETAENMAISQRGFGSCTAQDSSMPSSQTLPILFLITLA